MKKRRERSCIEHLLFATYRARFHLILILTLFCEIDVIIDIELLISEVPKFIQLVSGGDKHVSFPLQ